MNLFARLFHFAVSMEIIVIFKIWFYLNSTRPIYIQGSSGFYRFASNVEPFRDLLNDWPDDDLFAEQRLSGCNPMVLRRVTEDSGQLTVIT